VPEDLKSNFPVFEQQSMSGRQHRWMAFFDQFDLDIAYRSGKLNAGADALSRSPAFLTVTSLSVTKAFFKELQDAYSTDPDFAPIVKALTSRKQTADPSVVSVLPRYKIADNKLYYLLDDEPRLCVPASGTLRATVLHDCHDATTSGHPGVGKTLDLLRRKFYWPRMDKTVQRYVDSCEDCQRQKPRNQASKTFLHPLEIPRKQWQSISMDFITHLPLTAAGFDAILVVLDRLTKMAHFVPAKGTDTAETTSRRFFDNIFRLHGLPDEIVSDRDPKFTGSSGRPSMVYWALNSSCPQPTTRRATDKLRGQTGHSNSTSDSTSRTPARIGTLC